MPHPSRETCIVPGASAGAFIRHYHSPVPTTGETAPRLSLFRQRFRRHPVRWTIGLLAVIAGVVFSLEGLALRLRLPPFTDPVGQIQVHRLYVLKKARNKVDILPAEWEAQDCVRALFPHRGLTPCWWLARHTEQQVEME